MSISGLSPVTAILLADTAEYSAKMDEAQGKMEALGAESDTLGAKFTKFGNLAADAVLGLGVAATGFALDEGVKLNETMDQLQNATGLSDAAIKVLTQDIIAISDKTGASTSDLATSLASIEQAGIHGAKAVLLLDDAAKASLATNTNVTQVTSALVAVQALHLKGTKDLTDATGLLVAGSHNFVGGLSAEASLLQGKVGAAFSEYGFTLKQAIEYGSIFAKVGLPTRSIATLATGLGKILAPIHTVTDSNGKLEHGISSTYLAIEQLGLKYSKVASDVRTGNLSGLLLYLKDVAQQTKEPLSVLLNTVLGSGGSISGSLLLKNLGAVKTVTDSIKGAGAGSLNSAFTTASEQFGNKMKIIETNLVNSAAQFGLKIIPYLSDAASFLEKSLTSLENHPLEQKALEIDLGATFAAALGLKIAQATQSATQTSLLAKIAANTSVSAGEGGVSDVEGGGSAIGTFGKYVGVFAAGALAFEGTAEFLKTKTGKNLGNYLIDNNFLGLGTVSNDLANVLHKRIYASSGITGGADEKYLKSIGEWGNYLKLIEADTSANYKEVAILSAAIQRRENKAKGRVTINIGNAHGQGLR
jgi:TP901 family phage tail tape measure protein